MESHTSLRAGIWLDAIGARPQWRSEYVEPCQKDPPVSQDEFSGKAANVLWLCNQLHSAMLERCHLRHRLAINIIRLSEREIEVLKWTAKGKIASDIAMILSLSTRTVNFHISSAMTKLGASNKTSAVVMAARFGLL